MACATIFRGPTRHLRYSGAFIAPQCFQSASRRSFITLPGTEITSLYERRILPYNSASLYTLISDIDSYSTFLPYCQDSKVTKWSAADDNGKIWPAEADLKVGWGGIQETFTSRVFCVPGSIVEALGGNAVSKLPKSDIKHHAPTFNTPGTAGNIFTSMSTRWTVRPSESTEDRTEVRLTIDFQFANPIYGALSSAVAPKLASTMIEAFERRAKLLLDKTTPVANEKGC
jgi:coenzyme Q-binding protein COQ10